jgi:hypothetical protein
MDEKYKKNNNLDKYDCLELNSAEDVKGVVRLVVQEIFGEDSEVANAGRITNMLQVFLKATEITKLDEIEERLKALESGKECTTKTKTKEKKVEAS